LWSSSWKSPPFFAIFSILSVYVLTSEEKMIDQISYVVILRMS
jgi:hypothetical protein